MANKKVINVVHESWEAIAAPDSPEARRISKYLEIPETTTFVKWTDTRTDSTGRYYTFEIDEGHIGEWEERKLNAMQEVENDVRA